MTAQNPRTAVKLRDLASLLASPHPVDHLVGLGKVRAIEDSAQAPILLHVLRTCDPAVQHLLMERIASFGQRPVRQAVEQMLESDGPHPMSAAHYLSLAKSRAYNGLVLSWLPRSAEPVQKALLAVLAQTADARSWPALSDLLPHLSPEAALEAKRLLARRLAKRALQGPAPAIANRPPPSRMRLGLPSLTWTPPSRGELLAWAASALASLPLLVLHSKAPTSPSELLTLLALALTSSRCLLGFPRLGTT